jgi:peroxiredoxin
MTTLRLGEAFSDFELPGHGKRPRRLSGYTRPSPLDERLGFDDGYPLILVFGRGFFCPRDREQMRGLVRFQSEPAVNYCQLLSISANPPMVAAAFRAGLGAKWPFLSDERREVIQCIQQESKALTRVRSQIRVPAISSGRAGTACRFNGYDERCRPHCGLHCLFGSIG